MLACQKPPRDKFTDVANSTSARQTANQLACVSDGDVSLGCKRSVGVDEIVLDDWLIYYIQAGFSVKVFVRPISQSICNFLSDNSLVVRPVFWGENELYLFAVFCQGFSATNLRIRSQSRFVPLPSKTAKRYYMRPGRRVKWIRGEFRHFKVKDSDYLRKKAAQALNEKDDGHNKKPACFQTGCGAIIGWDCCRGFRRCAASGRE